MRPLDCGTVADSTSRIPYLNSPKPPTISKPAPPPTWHFLTRAVWMQSFLSTHPFLQFQQNKELQRTGLIKYGIPGPRCVHVHLQFLTFCGDPKTACSHNTSQCRWKLYLEIVKNRKLRNNEGEIFQLTLLFLFSLNLKTLEQRNSKSKVLLTEKILKDHLCSITTLLGESFHINNFLTILKLSDNLG